MKVYLPDPLGWSGLNDTQWLVPVCMVAFPVITTVTRRALPRPLHIVVVACLSIACLASPFYLPQTHIARHGFAWGGAVFVWKMLECSLGVGPIRDLDRKPWVRAAYVCSPLQPEVDTAKDVVKGTWGDYFASIRTFAVMQLLLSAWATLVPEERAIKPFDNLYLDSYVNNWILYLFMNRQFAMIANIVAGLGWKPGRVFRGPLLSCRSPADFWGRRWNITIHGLIKRTVFDPLRRRGAGAFAASMAAFGASGLLHCYMIGAMGHIGAADLGWLMVFFLVQPPIIAIQLWLGNNVFRGSSKWPTPFCVVLNTLVSMPLAPLFMGLYQRSDFFLAVHRYNPRLELPEGWWKFGKSN